MSRSHTWEKFASGVTAVHPSASPKKILLANPMGRVADAAFDAQSLSTPDAWFGAARAYAFQIYFDFSGYSDMAIGLGQMIDFEFLKNFDSPYHAESITDFWQRLLAHFAEYVLARLALHSFGRQSKEPPCAPTLTLSSSCFWAGSGMARTGHSSHGERITGSCSPSGTLIPRQAVTPALWPQPIRVAATFVLVLISWVPFRSARISIEATNYLGAMIGLGAPAPRWCSYTALLYTQGRRF